MYLFRDFWNANLRISKSIVTYLQITKYYHAHRAGNNTNTSE
jgi:hypothetical protein